MSSYTALLFLLVCGILPRPALASTSCVSDSFSHGSDNYDAKYRIWSTSAALCVNTSTGGRVEYYGKECGGGSGDILWVYAVTIVR
jgi:hypothetical protein